jgi:tape measure domain-containing protein
MASFADLIANLNLNITNFASGLKQASSLASSFASSLSGKINSGMTDPAKKAGVQFKDVSRIVQGILISQAFYAGLNVIKQCTTAVWDFSTSLEYSKVAYATLFNSVSEATEFTNVLQDYAAKTPFTFQQTTDAAKMLLAYGTKAKNVMYEMNGVLDASAITGNAQTVESVARAFGQITTKGRLMNEEMRQLTDAGIPAYSILQEKLGLTQKQLQNLAKNEIDSNTALNALVSGLEERYGNAAKATALTITGLISNITDDFKSLGASLFTPVTNGIRTMLKGIEAAMTSMVTIYGTKGLGGVFEAIIPKGMQGAVRQLIAEFMELGNIAKVLGSALKNLLGATLTGIVNVLNIILPVLIPVFDILARVLQAITANKTAMAILSDVLGVCAIAWALFAQKALLGFILKPLITTIKDTAAALARLAIALVENPIITVLGLIFVALAAVTLSSTAAGQALKNMFKQLTAVSGVNPDKILLPSQTKRTADLSKFNQALKSTKTNMDDVAKSTKKAADGLQSFDEVYQLNETDTGTAAATPVDTSDLTDGLNLGNGSGLDLSSLMPTTADFMKFGKDFVDTLWGSVKNMLLSAGIGAGIGAVLGAIIGGIFGGPGGAILGAKIGALVGAIVGTFWSTLTTPQKWSVGIGASAGAILGGIIGTLIAPGLGTAIGAGLGTAIGGAIGYFWSSLTTPQKWKVGIGGGVGAVVGGIVGTILLPGLGTAIGIALGAGVGSAIGYFWDNIVGWFKSSTGTGAGIGAIIGGIIGTIICPGLGTALGAALGGGIGGVIGYFWKNIVGWFKSSTGTGAGIGAIIGGIIGTVICPGLGTALGAALGGTLGGVIGNFWPQISQFFVNVKNTVGDFFTKTIPNWAGSVGTTISGPFIKAKDWVVGAWGKLASWFDTTVFTPVKGIATSVASKISGAWTSAVGTIQKGWDAVSGWFNTNIFTPIHDVGVSVLNTFVGAWVLGAGAIQTGWTKVSGWFGEHVWKPIKDAATTAKDWIGARFNDAKTNVQGAWTTVSSWWDKNVWGNIQNGAATAKDWIGTKFGEAKTNLANAWTTVSGWWDTNVWGNIQKGATTAKDWIGTKFGEAKTKLATAWSTVSGWWDTNVWTNIKKGATTAKDWIGTKFGEAKTKLSTAWGTVSGWWDTNVWSNIKKGATTAKDWIGTKFGEAKTGLSTAWGTVSGWWDTNVWTNIKKGATTAGGWIGTKLDAAKTALTKAWNGIGTWFDVHVWTPIWKGASQLFGWIGDGIKGLQGFLTQLADLGAKITGQKTSTGKSTITAHATGGVFNKEHIATFAEQNKPEAIIPLSTEAGMAPFVNAVTNGVITALAAMQQVNKTTQSSGDQPLIIQAGMVFADERSLRQLNRKLQVIQASESKR